MVDSTLAKLEENLLRVPGVKSARVVGDDRPSEIHVVASARRSPKQVVRDVQSLAAAGFGMQIDHRIVSVVQLDESPPPPPPPPPATVDLRNDRPQIEPEAPSVQPEPKKGERRLVLERVVLASKGDSGWVKVALRWPDGTTTDGAGAAGASREARARGAAQALLQALQPALSKTGAKLDVDQVMLQKLGTHDSVLARVVFYEQGVATPLVGSAIVHDDVASAAVRALLQAINRKLRLNQPVSA
jgi:hypothetical protein